MSSPRILTLALAIVVPFVLTGCGGGGAKTETEVTNTTVSKGQQLIDLKAALDAGAITQDEYDKERERLLSE